MKKFKTLFLTAVVCLGTASAQTPVIGVSFQKASGTSGTIEYANSVMKLSGSDKANHTYGACPQINLGGTGDYCCYSDAASKKYVLHVNNTAAGYFWVKYNADDALGTAFANGGTWELLFRLSAFTANNYDAEGVEAEARMTKIIGSQESGGWSLRHQADTGLDFQYVTTTGTTTLQPGRAKTKLSTGEYYHVVVTVDKSTNTMTMYINGEKVGSKTHAYVGGEFQFPNIGTTRHEENMWFSMGCDPGNSDEPSNVSVNNSARASFVFFNYYGDVLTADQIETRANDATVQKFINPAVTNTSDLMWDVLPGAGNTVTDQSPYNTIATRGTLATAYNSTFKRYEVVNSTPTSGNLAYRDYFAERTITQRLAKNMAIEVYCKAGSALPTSTTTPMSFQQNGGFGFEFQTTGKVAFNYNNYGYRTSTSKGGGANLHLSSDANYLDTDYHHFIATVDNVIGKSSIYRDGVLVKEFTVTADDMLYQEAKFPHAAYQWFCFNGDVKGVRTSSCDYPFDGNIVFGRVWGKTLTAADAAALSAQAVATSLDVTVDASKVTTAIFPFAAVVPAGVKAYVVDAISSGEANTVLYASEGEIIPYGTPVLLYGAAGTYTFNAADLPASVKSAPAKNLLTGSFASKVAEADQISVLCADGKAFETAAANDEVAPLKAWLPAGNVVLRGEIPVVKFDESYDIAGLSSYTGENVDFTFTRSFTSGVAATVCLPFAFTSAKASDGMTDGGKFYTFKSVDLDAMTVYMEEDNKISAGMTAGVPYLFVPDVTGEVTFTGSETVPATPTTADQVKDDWTFAGTYSRIDWDNADKFTGYDGVYGFVVNAQSTLNPGDFAKVKIGGSAYTPAFRAIMKYKAPAGSRPFSAKAAPSAPQKMKVVLIGADGTVTGVSQIDVMEQGSEWYTVDGKKLQGKPTTKGIYIRDGKKVWVSK